MCTEFLCAEIVALCADIHRAEYRLLALIEKLDAAKPWRHEAMPTCAHWLNAHCGLDLVTAREKVRVANALPRLPLIRECFRSGELSYSKVRAITRVAGSDNEEELVQMARRQSAAHVARNVAAMRQAERLSESKVAFDAYRHRMFACHTDEDGSLVFEGRLPADQGALLMRALERAMDWLVRGVPSGDCGRDHDNLPTHDVHQSRVDQPDRDGANVDALPQTVRRADALAIIAERFLSEPPQADEGLNTADRFQITVHAPAEALLEHGIVSADDPPQIEDGAVLATETLRRIACDGAIVRILETGAGEPLDIGRKTRVIPPAMRRARSAATAAVVSRTARTRVSSMVTTSRIGRTAAPRASITSCCCVAITIGCCTKGCTTSCATARTSSSAAVTARKFQRVVKRRSRR
jgi:hypothetical protein